MDCGNLTSLSAEQVNEPSVQQSNAVPQNPFQGYRGQPDGLQTFLGNTPQTALIAAAVVLVGASGFLGNVIGSQAPGSLSPSALQMIIFASLVCLSLRPRQLPCLRVLPISTGHGVWQCKSSPMSISCDAATEQSCESSCKHQ